MESEFFYGEHLRWRLFWASPNSAAIALAMALPFVWWAVGRFWRQRKALGIAFVVVEAGLTFCLLKTYSRGGLLALAVSGAWLVALRLRLSWGNGPMVRRTLLLFTLRLLAVVAVVMAIGFAGRISYQTESGDASVGNRLELWRLGSGLMAVAPWTGLGPGESGYEYMQWMQPVERDVTYTGMVNSYLEVAIEFGIPVAAGGVVALLSMAILPAFSRGDPVANSEIVLPAFCSASLVSWLCGNVFTSFWDVANLWILPAISMVVIAWTFRGAVARLAQIALVCGGCAVLACLFVLGYARSAQADQGLAISRHGKSVWRVARGGERMGFEAQARRSVHVFPDPTTLGENPGKFVRSLVLSASTDSEFLYHDPRYSQDEVDGDVAIVCGGQSERIDAEFASAFEKVVVVRPTAACPLVDTPDNIVVILSEIDPKGMQVEWSRFRFGNAIRFEDVYATAGYDIRRAGPMLIVDNL